nr:hypothetical protein [uncultured Oscillibacter sp.]
MWDRLIYIVIGLGLCYFVYQWKKPLVLRLLVIATLAVLTLLSWKVPLARYPLFTAGIVYFSGQCWNSWKSPNVSAPGLLFLAVLFGILPFIGLARQLTSSYPYRGAELAELLFECLIALPIGFCSAVSFIRLQKNKQGRHGQEKG